MKLGFIGTGRISTAVIESLARDSYEIFISRRGKKNSKRLSEAYENVLIGNNQEVVNQSDVVFIGLTADKAEKALETLRFSNMYDTYMCQSYIGRFRQYGNLP